MKPIIQELRRSALAVFLLAVIACGIYPASVALAGRVLYPGKADGSLIRSGDGTAGSSLLARGFSGERFFHPRPSAAGDGYDALKSGGSNLGPLSKKLIETVRARVQAYRAENGLPPETPVPADAVTASGSGLDPHISLENARIQAGRIARARGLAVEEIMSLVRRHSRGRTLGVLGAPRVNVLELNLDLERKLAR